MHFSIPDYIQPCSLQQRDDDNEPEGTARVSVLYDAFQAPSRFFLSFLSLSEKAYANSKQLPQSALARLAPL